MSYSAGINHCNNQHAFDCCLSVLIGHHTSGSQSEAQTTMKKRRHCRDDHPLIFRNIRLGITVLHNLVDHLVPRLQISDQRSSQLLRSNLAAKGGSNKLPWRKSTTVGQAFPSEALTSIPAERVVLKVLPPDPRSYCPGQQIRIILCSVAH